MKGFDGVFPPQVVLELTLLRARQRRDYWRSVLQAMERSDATPDHLRSAWLQMLEAAEAMSHLEHKKLESS